MLARELCEKYCTIHQRPKHRFYSRETSFRIVRGFRCHGLAVPPKAKNPANKVNWTSVQTVLQNYGQCMHANQLCGPASCGGGGVCGVRSWAPTRYWPKSPSAFISKPSALQRAQTEPVDQYAGAPSWRTGIGHFLACASCAGPGRLWTFPK